MTLIGGEIHVRGETLFEGYGYPPKKTDGWHQTGDLGSYDELHAIKSPDGKIFNSSAAEKISNRKRSNLRSSLIRKSNKRSSFRCETKNSASGPQRM